MSKYYDNAIIPNELRRTFDVYDRIKDQGVELGTYDDNVVSLANAGIAAVVFQESGLVVLVALEPLEADTRHENQAQEYRSDDVSLELIVVALGRRRFRPVRCQAIEKQDSRDYESPKPG